MNSHINKIVVIALLAFMSSQIFAQSQPNGWAISTRLSAIESDNPNISSINSNNELGLDSTAASSFSIAYLFDAYSDLKIRAELEIMQHAQDINSNSSNAVSFEVDSDLSVRSTMLNTYFELHNSTVFTPYLGAGIGKSRLDFETSPIDSSAESALSVQFMAGISYSPAIANRLDLVLGVRQLIFEDVGFSFGDMEDYQVTATDFSIRYKF